MPAPFLLARPALLGIVLLAAALLSGSIATAQPLPRASDACGPLPDADRAACEDECIRTPLVPRCLLASRFGAPGLVALAELEADPSLDAAARAAAAGMAPSDAAAFRWFITGLRLWNDPDNPTVTRTVVDPELSRALHELVLACNESGDNGFVHITYECYQQAAELAAEVYGEDDLYMLGFYSILGHLSQANGDFVPGEAHFVRASALATRYLPQDHPRRLSVLREEAHFRFLRGGPDRLAQLERLEALHATTAQVLGPFHPESLTAQRALAAALRTAADYRRAREHVDQLLARTALTHGPRSAEMAAAYETLGDLYFDLGDYQAASTVFVQALDRVVAIYGADSNPAAIMHRSLGRAQAMQARHDDATANLRVALVNFGLRLGDRHPQYLLVLDELARLELEHGNPERALAMYEKSLATRRGAFAIPDRYFALTAEGTAVTLLRLGRTAEAVVLLEESLAVFEAISGARSPDAGRVHMRLAMARLALEEAQPAVNHQHLASAIAREHYRENVLASWHDLQALDFLRSLRGQLDASLSVLTAPEHALRAFEDVLAWQGAGVVFERIRHQERLLYAALTPAQKARFDALADLRRQQALTPGTTPGTTPGDDARRNQLATDIRKLERELSRVPAFKAHLGHRPATHAAVCKTLRASKSTLVAYVVYNRPRPPEAAARAGGPSARRAPLHEAMLAAFVVPPTGPCAPVRVELGPVSTAAYYVTHLRDGLDAAEGCFARRGVAPLCMAEFAEVDARAAALRREVWEPLAPHLGKVESIVVAPDGPLTEVAFDALPDPSGRYLIEDFLVRYVPAPAVLAIEAPAAKASAKAQNRGAFVAGDLDHDAAADSVEGAIASWSACSRGGCEVTDDAPPRAAYAVALRARDVAASPCGYEATWGALRTEAGHVAPYLARVLGEDATLVTGASALEPAVVSALSGRRVIHLATHGFYSPAWQCSGHAFERVADAPPGAGYRADPLRLSAVVLSGANARPSTERAAHDDGILTAREVVGLDLRGTDIVALSACETGRGEVVPGEGALGLARAFLIAGADTAVVSLWRVPSAQTQSLFEAFYAHAYEGKRGLPPARALHRAKLDTLARLRAGGLTSSSYLWAAFVPTSFTVQ